MSKDGYHKKTSIDTKICLGCQQEFASLSRYNRICEKCKESTVRNGHIRTMKSQVEVEE